MIHAALLLLMLEAMTTDLVFTISLKRSTQNLQLSTSWAGDYTIFCSASLTHVGHRAVVKNRKSRTFWQFQFLREH
jgi:hypothetical protein